MGIKDGAPANRSEPTTERAALDEMRNQGTCPHLEDIQPAPCNADKSLLKFSSLKSARAIPPSRHQLHPSLVMTPQNENTSKLATNRALNSGKNIHLNHVKHLGPRSRIKNGENIDPTSATKPGSACIIDHASSPQPFIGSQEPSYSISSIQTITGVSDPLAGTGEKNKTLAKQISGRDKHEAPIMGSPSASVSLLNASVTAESMSVAFENFKAPGTGGLNQIKSRESSRRDWWRRDPHPMFSPKYAAQRLLIE